MEVARNVLQASDVYMHETSSYALWLNEEEMLSVDQYATEVCYV
jgi:hypothetical protein